MRALRELFWWSFAFLLIAITVGVAAVWNIATSNSIGVDKCRRVQVLATTATVSHDLGIRPDTIREWILDDVPEDSRLSVTAIVALAYESNLSIPEMYSRSGSLCQDLNDFATKMGAK
ncbi:hypothetical protein [Paraburkholderia saeva]|uniref:hypothetical protein n=1 Tax=Paraburkholderia saeva TaxID=2777537 RepID=UPI001D63B799|nr:hypothetical protein [Paraburkholderia saeva]CAG4908281.1 hypothetical protein R52603_03612 [Paraburkholderia saeva]